MDSPGTTRLHSRANDQSLSSCVCKLSFASANLEHFELPWLAALLGSKTLNVMESSDLKILSTTIEKVKKFSPENKLIWLSRPWFASASELQVQRACRTDRFPSLTLSALRSTVPGPV
jgi:hypothetical protein